MTAATMRHGCGRDPIEQALAVDLVAETIFAFEREGARCRVAIALDGSA